MRLPAKIALGAVAAAIAAAIAIPNLLEPKISWNDWAAIAALKNLAHVQEEFRLRTLVDVDGDGIGEYGTFGEMTGADGRRADPEGNARLQPVSPPLLSASFSFVDDGGRTSKSGYLFRILLPGRDGRPVHEGRAGSWSGGVCPVHGPCPGPPSRPPCSTCRTPPPKVLHPGTGFSGPVDTDAAEKRWCAYAWPVQDYGELKGNHRFHHRVLFTDGNGSLWQTMNQDRRYFGTARSPSWDAAMPEDGWGVAWGTAPAGVEEYRGRDGNLWRLVK